MKLKTLLTAIAITMICGACNEGNGGNSSDDNRRLGLDESKIQGGWSNSICDNYGGVGYERSSLRNILISGPDLVIQSNTFNGSTCSNSPTDVWKIHFSFETSISTNADPSIYNFDATLKSMTWTVYDQDTANAFNTQAFCGFTDWVVDEEKDIIGLSCVTGLNQVGSKHYSILKVSDDHLQFGESDETYDGSTPALRPIKLSSDVFSKLMVPGRIYGRFASTKGVRHLVEQHRSRPRRFFSFSSWP